MYKIAPNFPLQISFNVKKMLVINNNAATLQEAMNQPWFQTLA